MQLNHDARQNVAACISMVALTAIVTVARFALRALRRQRPNGADWMCLLSIPMFYAYCGIILNFIYNTSLYGSFTINPLLGVDEMRNLLKVTYASEILFAVIITVIKLSILWLYYEIFAQASRMFHNLVKAAAVICVIWCLVSTFVVIFQCRPVSGYWELFTTNPTCLSTPKLLLGCELTNLFLDVMILCLPIPLVWSLNITKTKRVGVLIIFLLGSFVCVASIVRLTTIWNPPHVMQNFQFANAMLWSTLQLGFAIICACLPTLGPCFLAITGPLLLFTNWSTSLFSRGKDQSGDSAYGAHQENSYYGQITNPPPEKNGRLHGPLRRLARENGHQSQTVMHADIEEVPLQPVSAEGYSRL